MAIPEIGIGNSSLNNLYTGNITGREIASADDTQNIFDGTQTDSVSLSSAAETKESEKIQEEIEELEKEKEANEKKMEKLEKEIEKLAEEAEENIKKAAKIADEAVEKHEKEVDQIVKKEINAYIEANKNGEPMTRAQLQANIEGAVSVLPQDVASAVVAATKANDQLNDIESLNGELRNLIDATQAITTQIDTKQGEYETAVAAECCPPPTSCDPIGFAMTDEEGNEVKYDFIVDDGAFDSTRDFLGSKDQWQEMQALDQDGNGIVDANELAAGNIKAVKTDANGQQTVVDIAEEFGSEFSVDLNSYKEGGTYAGIEEVDANGNGLLDQELLGTFSLNIGGKNVEGYNTLDDTEWLNENYNLGAAAGANGETSVDGINNAEGKLNADEYSEDLQEHVTFFNTYVDKIAAMREELDRTYAGLGIAKEDMDAYNTIAKTEADADAAKAMEEITKELEEEEAKEAAANEEETAEVEEDEAAKAAQDQVNAQKEEEAKAEEEKEEELEKVQEAKEDKAA